MAECNCSRSGERRPAGLKCPVHAFEPGLSATILGMVRVEFADREPVEYENVTEIEFSTAGGVMIRTQPLQRFPDPQNLSVIRTIPTGPPRLLGAWSKDSHWTHVYQTEDESAAAERPSLEVAR